MAPSGVLVYQIESGEVASRLVLVDRRGRLRQALTEAGAYRQPRFSPDGDRIAAEKSSLTGGNSDLWHLRSRPPEHEPRGRWRRA